MSWVHSISLSKMQIAILFFSYFLENYTLMSSSISSSLHFDILTQQGLKLITARWHCKAGWMHFEVAWALEVKVLGRVASNHKAAALNSFSCFSLTPSICSPPSGQVILGRPQWVRSVLYPKLYPIYPPTQSPTPATLASLRPFAPETSLLSLGHTRHVPVSRCLLSLLFS